MVQIRLQAKILCEQKSTIEHGVRWSGPFAWMSIQPLSPLTSVALQCIGFEIGAGVSVQADMVQPLGSISIEDCHFLGSTIQSPLVIRYEGPISIQRSFFSGNSGFGAANISGELRDMSCFSVQTNKQRQQLTTLCAKLDVESNNRKLFSFFFFFFLSFFFVEYGSTPNYLTIAISENIVVQSV